MWFSGTPPDQMPKLSVVFSVSRLCRLCRPRLRGDTVRSRPMITVRISVPGFAVRHHVQVEEALPQYELVAC